MSSEVSLFAVGPIRRGLHLAIMTDSNTTWDYKMSYQHPLRTTNMHLASGQTIMTDAPQDNHGLGQMFSPTDLLSTSLAACVATIIGIHVNSKDYELISIDANIQKKMASQPRRVAAIKIEFIIEVSSVASDQDLVLLERSGRACPVAKSIHPDVVQDLSFTFKRA